MPDANLSQYAAEVWKAILDPQEDLSIGVHAGAHVLCKIGRARIQARGGCPIAPTGGAVAYRAVGGIERLASRDSPVVRGQRVDRAALLARAGDRQGKRHLNLLLVGAQHHRLDRPIPDHAEELAARLEAPAAHRLGLDLVLAHIHAQHGEAQPQIADIERLAR